MNIKEILSELRKESYESIVLSEPEILRDAKKIALAKIDCLMADFKENSKRFMIYNKIIKKIGV